MDPAPAAPAARSDIITLEDLGKQYGAHTAVERIDLTIATGEFFSLLGPSGCGKTTTLRMIAGFETPTRGRVLIDGVDMSRVGPEQRPVNTVFQNYALFPHLTVAENVAFGLRFAKEPATSGGRRRDHARRAGEALELVRLSGLEQRLPHQLSGGQQQRVALARALVLRPKVLLLDEPLGALDAKLRKTLQIELVTLQREVGITFVYVTHDQEEALTMSDRIAVMDHGLVAQVGSPRDVYERPATSYVADFLGVANLIDAVATGDGACTVAGRRIAVADAGTTTGPVRIVIRPERLTIVGSDEPADLEGRISHLVYAGSAHHVHVTLAEDLTVQVLVPNDGRPLDLSPGDLVRLACPADAARLLTA